MRPLLFCALLCCHPATAIDRISFSAARVSAAGGIEVRGLQASIDLPARSAPALNAQATELRVRALPAPLGGVQLHCATVRLQEPEWRCANARLRIARSMLGELQAGMQLSLDSARRSADIHVADLPIAGGRLQLRATVQSTGWQIEAASLATALQPLAAWLRPWWRPPAGSQYAGELSLQVSAAGRGATVTQATIQAQGDELNLQNAAGTVVTEKLAARVQLRLRGSLQRPEGELQLDSTAGQALAGPALLDFAAHPLQLRGALGATLDGAARQLSLSDVQLVSGGLVEAHGEAQLAPGAGSPLRTLRIDVTQLRFPSAYTSFLQLALAASDFGNLDSSGSVSGQLTVRDGRLAALDLATGDDGLRFSDVAKGLDLQGLQGAFHWLPAGGTAAADSRLRWRSLRAFGMSGGAAALALRAQGDALQLVEPARIPLFDGALAVQRFEARRLGAPDVTLAFDGRVESIGMPTLSRAFGWPEMAGTLSGRLPGLEYRAGTLRVAGDLSAQVFDGSIVASGLQLRDAFGRFPRFSGNFSARRLDLEQITRTFPIGSITGRLDADVRGLELFGWTPVAFDAQMYTSPGDRTRHRISQKAVGSLASLGGSGGVVSALQSGFLRFFDDFGYDRIGLRCELRDDVCLMNGIGQAEGGFFIVKGGGLPRLDVIGTAGRVAWSQLVSQVRTALASGEVEVR